MRHWFSRLPLNAALVALLSEAGLEPWPTVQGSTPEADCLLLYDRPDRIVLSAAAAKAPITLQQIDEAYSQLLICAEATGQPLLAGWRLEQHSAATLQQWMTDGSRPAATHAPTMAIPPLLAAAILGLLEVQPELLDTYSDLELRAELLGDEPDLHYRQLLRLHLQQADPMADLLATFQTPAIVRELGEELLARDAELSEAREQADRITNQLQPRLQELEQQLQTSDTQLREAREEAELTLLQLHQVQEELEHYFLLSRGQDVLLNQYGEQQLRVQQLLGRLITGAEAPAVAPRH
jgi:cellobiose-specific phosphotransferase system component IIA